jgi:UDPglucose 6-dehydrogenase
VVEAARDIGAHLHQYAVIVDKSTVPVGMAEQVQQVILQALQERGLEAPFDVVSNPEFLREGAAIEDFMHPDRIIIGLKSDNAKRIMLDLYLPLLRSLEHIYFMSVKEAEMTKYVANGMLAARISFMNEMAVLCEHLDVDIEKVRIGVGSDARIGPLFLNPGCGYGGSCFPKDVVALIKMAEQHGVDPTILRAVEKRNREQKQLLTHKILRRFGEDLTGVTLAVWGLSFKPGTDDMREASSLVLIGDMLQRGAQVQAYDPAAIPKARTLFAEEWIASGKLAFAEHQYDALRDADALALVTEWKPFCYPDVNAMKSLMRKPIVFDGRNQYDPWHMQAAGFEYYGIGRGKRLQQALDSVVAAADEGMFMVAKHP